MSVKVTATAQSRLLPLVGEHCPGKPVGIRKQVGSGDQLGFRGCGIGNHHRADREVIDVVDRRRRRREHGFQHAVGVLVDGADAYRQPSELRRHREGRACRTHQFSADVVMENGYKSARARVFLDLPEVADGSGDGTWVIRIGHTRDRHPEGLTLGRGRVGVAGRRVEDRQHAHWLGIFAGHQDDRLVGELQPLDVGETVDAVGADGVGDGDDIVRRVAHCAVGIDVDRIVGPRPGEVDGVEVVIGAGIPRQDLTNDPELAGVVGAVDHQRDHVGSCCRRRRSRCRCHPDSQRRRCAH